MGLSYRKTANLLGEIRSRLATTPFGLWKGTWPLSSRTSFLPPPSILPGYSVDQKGPFPLPLCILADISFHCHPHPLL